MKKIYNHYKFKALRLLVIFGLTFPLRYSFSNNVGMIVLILSVLEFVGEDPLINQDLCLITGLIGMFMSSNMIVDILDKYTIKD